MAHAISVTITMPTVSLRCVASIEVAVEAIDLGTMQMTSSKISPAAAGYHLHRFALEHLVARAIAGKNTGRGESDVCHLRAQICPQP
jgi:hypothetical protein